MNKSLRPIRSFVHRHKKLSKRQQLAFNALPYQHLLSTHLSFKKLFERKAYTVLEIGFGMGDSLLQQALHYPENNYLGIEVHRPGIAFMLMQIEKHNLKNIKIFYADAVKVLAHSIPKHSLDTIQIFFPDPWPKTRHHKRRLIQPEFIELLHERLKWKITSCYRLGKLCSAYVESNRKFISMEKSRGKRSIYAKTHNKTIN